MQGHGMRNTLLGLGVGAGDGLALGVGVDGGVRAMSVGVYGHPQHDPNAVKFTGTPSGAAAGAMIGAFLPTGGWLVVYRTE